CRHGRSRAVQALCVVSKLMVEFPVGLIQKLPVVFSCAEYGCFQVRSLSLFGSPFTSARNAKPVGSANAHNPPMISQPAPYVGWKLADPRLTPQLSSSAGVRFACAKPSSR